MKFVEDAAVRTDVFCFQEILSDPRPSSRITKEGFRTNLLQELSARLPDFSTVFAPVQVTSNLEPIDRACVQTGVAIFLKNTLHVVAQEAFLLPAGTREDNAHHNAQYVTIEINGSLLTFCNVHGIAHPGHKRDTPERLAQSHKILDTLANIEGEKIVMGDFNLLPDTQSARLFEEAGFRNLVKECSINSTRGSHHKILHPEFSASPEGFQEFADYTFVQPTLNVQRFDAPDIPISDHLPMILDCTM